MMSKWMLALTAAATVVPATSMAQERQDPVARWQQGWNRPAAQPRPAPQPAPRPASPPPQRPGGGDGGWRQRGPDRPAPPPAAQRPNGDGNWRQRGGDRPAGQSRREQDAIARWQQGWGNDTARPQPVPNEDRRDWNRDRDRDGRRDDRRDWRNDRDRDARRDDRRDWRSDRDWNRERYRRNQWGAGDRQWYGDNGSSWGWNGGRDRGDWDRGGGWNRDWRRDRRYDWRDYRQANRGIYRLPRYYAPRGYTGYRRLGIGFTMSTMLFGPDYWISDPWAYRLPDAYGPYRWVRYYNDALLVDLETGEVIDVEYDMFW